jgi:hypothetical protein
VSPSSSDISAGFLIKHSSVDPAVFLEENGEEDCLLEGTDLSEDAVVPLRSSRRTFRDLLVHEDQEGYYNTYFVSCIPDSRTVSFVLNLTQYNVDPVTGERSYLSAGLVNLPAMYAVFCGIYVIVLAYWWVNYMAKGGSSTNTIHYLMTLLLVLKAAALLFKTIDYHFLDVQGEPGSWGIVYWCLNGVRALLMFVLIIMIGSGWKFVKPFLAERDHKIFFVVIPLQVLDNVALFIIEESAPGSQGFFTWKDAFRLLDILCCAAILVPVISSITHLRQASSIDGKAARNLEKLKLFRQFYLMVVSYIYFTRIIIYLLDATLPFLYVWLGDLATEVATLVFFVLTGYLFKPEAENPYFKLHDSDDEESDDSHNESIHMGEQVTKTSAGKREGVVAEDV